MRAIVGMALPLILAGSQDAAREINPPRGGSIPLTNFDCLVLASLADSPRLISLASYRSEVAVEFREH